MFFMIGISQGMKEFEYHQTAICQSCGRYGSYTVFMTYSVLSLFFIPCFKWNKQYFVRMGCCGKIYPLDPELGKRIAKGEEVFINPEDLGAAYTDYDGEFGSGAGETSKWANWTNDLSDCRSVIKKIYIASPFFNEQECDVLSEVETIMKDRGFDVFSPREHEVREGNVGSLVWSKETFQNDKDAIDWCDCVVMLYWGNYSDSGTAWECGYAYATGKPVVVLQLGEASNLMVHEGSHTNIFSMEELKNYDFDEMPKAPFSGKMF